MRQTLVEMTTADTGKTYRIKIGEPNDNPQLWAVTLKCQLINRHTGSTDNFGIITREICVERETLEMAGLLPQPVVKGAEKETIETAEDLILRLLNNLGFYPTD